MPPDKGKRPYEWDTIPGPGAYTISGNQKSEGVLGAAPSYSMVGRKPVPGPSNASPGPVYSPRSKAQMGDGSSYTFGSSRDPGQLGGGGRKANSSQAPGPGDYDTHTTAKGASSLGDSPRYGFGTASQRESHSARGRRFISHRHAQASNYGVASPGPMVYQIQDGLNTDLVDSSRPNSPRYSFRPKLPNYQTATASPAISARSPGPGSYSCQDGAFGMQARSSLRSRGGYSFGTAEQRQSAEANYKKNAYMGRDFHHANLCVHSPGPLVYPSRSTIGLDSTKAGSKFKAPPSFSFGTEDRFAY